MKAIDRLMEEHRAIEKTLDALDSWAGRLESGASEALEDAPAFVEYLQDFADQGHHFKEETLLFEAMVAAGFPKSAGPIAVMLSDHELGRGHVHTMEAAAREGSAGAARVAKAARAFSYLLRAHIGKEDNVLYVMAVQRLKPEVFAQLAQQFTEYDKSRAERTQALEASADRLYTKYRW